MNALFSGTGFFLGATGLSLGIIIIKKLGNQNSYRNFSLLLAILMAAVVYGEQIYKPLLLLFVSALALQLHRSNRLRKSIAIGITIAPLILAKVYGLPIVAMLGLSFATFRAVDVLLYADKKIEIDAFEYAAYLFFPLTLLAGPMYRWRDFKVDLAESFGRISVNRTLAGLEELALGIVQKFLIADAVNRFFLENLDSHDYSVKGIAANAIAYTAFLYFDFAGYSNMATGIGKMLGLNLPRNFNNPILSQNPQDFWRRWHISLSDWLRDVIFMPIYMALSRSRFFASRRLLAQNIALFSTLFVMGIWNGINRHYVLSGAMFGASAVAYNMLVSLAKSKPSFALIFENNIIRFIGRIANLAFIALALYVFSGRSPV